MASNNNQCSSGKVGVAASAEVLYKKSDYCGNELESTTSHGDLQYELPDKSTKPLGDQQTSPLKKQKTSPSLGPDTGSRPPTAADTNDEIAALASALALTDITSSSKDKEDHASEEDDYFEDARMETTPYNSSGSSISLGATNSYDLLGQFADDEAEAEE